MKNLLHGHVGVIDLGFGDAGKGSIVSALCEWSSDFSLVVRFNGGPQAAHRVVLPNGEAHVFHMFGSGTLRRVPTLLSRYVAIGPEVLLAEAMALGGLVPEPWKLLYLDRDAPVITPWQRDLNVHLERTRVVKHGTVGTGVRPCIEMAKELPTYAVKVRDFADPIALYEKLESHARIYPEIAVSPERVHRFLSICRRIAVRAQIVDGDELLGQHLHKGQVVFEGSQGVLLDDRFGFFPYTTVTRCTDVGIQDLSGAAAAEGVYILAVLRTYAVRHGHGPFPTEDKRLLLKDAANHSNDLQGDFRIGHFDFPLTRYAVKALTRVDGLAVTHVDSLSGPGRSLGVSYSYQNGEHHLLDTLPRGRDEQVQLTKDLIGARGVIVSESPHPDLIADGLGVPVRLTSAGERTSDKHLA